MPPIDDVFSDLYRLQQSEGTAPEGAAGPDAPDPALTEIHTRQTVQRNLSTPDPPTPDEAARRRNLSRESGLPEPLLEHGADEVERRLKLRRALERAEQAPATLRYLADPANAAISADDIEALADIEAAWNPPRMSERIRGTARKMGSSYEAGKFNVEMGEAYAEKMKRILLGETDHTAVDQRIAALERRRVTAPEDHGFIETGLTGAAEMLPLIFSSIHSGLRTGMQYTTMASPIIFGYGSAGPQAVTPIDEAVALGSVMAVGTQVGAWDRMFHLESGLALEELLAVRDENGDPIDPKIAAGAAAAIGSINASLELLSIKMIARVIPGAEKLFGKITTGSVKKLLENKSTRAAILNVLGKYGTAVGTETGTEVLQELTNVLLGNYAKGVAEDQDAAVSFADNKFDKKDAERLWTAGYEAFAATTFLGLPGAALSMRARTREAAEAKLFEADLDRVAQAMDASATKHRSQAAMQGFLEMVGAGEEIWIAPEFFQTDEDYSDIVATLDLDAAEVQASVANGADLRLNRAEALSKLSTEQIQRLARDAKPAPGAITTRQAEAFDESAEADALKTRQEELQQIQAQISENAKRVRLEFQSAGYGATYSRDLVDGLIKRFAKAYEYSPEQLAHLLKMIKVERNTFGRDQDQAYQSDGSLDTRARAFGQWFGQSKVVDEQGRPLRVSHGTVADFSVFRPGQHGKLDSLLGSHFAKNPTASDAFSLGEYTRVADYSISTTQPHQSWYRLGGEIHRDGIIVLKHPDGRREAWAEETHGPLWKVDNQTGVQLEMHRPGGRVMPVYLKMESPLMINNTADQWDEYAVRKAVANVIFPLDQELFIERAKRGLLLDRTRAAAAWEDLSAGRPHQFRGSFTAHDFGDVAGNWAGLMQGIDGDRVRAALKTAGYDGIIYRNTSKSETAEGVDNTAYIALDPTQIKSVFNPGQYSALDPDILHQIDKLPHPALAAGVKRDADGTIVFNVEASARALAEQDRTLDQGIETPTADGRFMRGSRAKTAPHAVKVLMAELDESVIVDDDQIASLAEAEQWAENSKYMLPQLTDQARPTRYNAMKSFYGNKKMIKGNASYPHGRDTYDYPGCGRMAWADANGLDWLSACYGGWCYAEQWAQRFAGSIAKGLAFPPLKAKDLRLEINDYYRKHGLVKTRNRFKTYNIRPKTAEERTVAVDVRLRKRRLRKMVNQVVAEEGIAPARKRFPYLKITPNRHNAKVKISMPVSLQRKGRTVQEVSKVYSRKGLAATRKQFPYYTITPSYDALSINRKEEAPVARVSDQLLEAKGRDIRLGVDTDGSAWLALPEVVDALHNSSLRSLSVYSSAYYEPPKPHPLSGRTIINVTVSGWHPLPETLHRLKWAETARANGWNVILREVTANPDPFGAEAEARYNRLHAALLKTDFFLMQQPLHHQGTYSQPQYDVPACCMGSQENPQTCDNCETAEGLGRKFLEYWKIKPEQNRREEIILPDLRPLPKLTLYQSYYEPDSDYSRGFYSQMIERAEATLPARGTGREMARTLRTWSGKKKINPDELDWVGLDLWLELPEHLDRVFTKAEVVKQLYASQLELKERTLAKMTLADAMEDDYVIERAYDNFIQDLKEGDYDNHELFEEAVDNAVDEALEGDGELVWESLSWDDLDDLSQESEEYYLLNDPLFRKRAETQAEEIGRQQLHDILEEHLATLIEDGEVNASEELNDIVDDAIDDQSHALWDYSAWRDASDMISDIVNNDMDLTELLTDADYEAIRAEAAERLRMEANSESPRDLLPEETLDGIGSELYYDYSLEGDYLERAAKEFLEDDYVSKAQYEEYTLPGPRDDYTEMVFFVPNRALAHDEYRLGTALQHLRNKIFAASSEAPEDVYYTRSFTPPTPAFARALDAAPPELQDAYAQANSALRAAEHQAKRDYEHSHYEDYQNFVAHARYTTRYTPDGDKVFYIDEIQSDWHREGREGGYGTRPVYRFAAMLNTTVAGETETTVAGVSKFRARAAQDAMNVMARKEEKAGQPFDAAEILIETNIEQEDNAVPEAPFKTSWQLVVLKRLLTLAVKEGYDKVMLSDGDAQLIVYKNVLKQIEAVRYNPTTQQLQFKSRSHPDWQGVKDKVPPSQLRLYLGDSLGPKLAQQPKEGWFQYLHREDIEEEMLMGGHKLRKAYDVVIPNKFNRFFGRKKWGNVRAKHAEIAVGELPPKNIFSPATPKAKTLEVINAAFKAAAAADDQPARYYLSDLYYRINRYDEYGYLYTREKYEKYGDLQRPIEEYIEEARISVVKTHHAWELPISDQMRKAIGGKGFPLFQGQGPQAPRGGYTPMDDQHLIQIFDDANPSTAIHETAHLFFQEMWAGTASGTASQKMQQDLAASLRWMGVAEGDPPTREQLEKFARGFEAYLWEGNAPTAELTGMFQRFKNFLRQVYEHISQLNVNLTDEMRAVFDRMLTDREAVEGAFDAAEMRMPDKGFLDAAGVVAEDRDYMARLIKQAKDAAEVALVKDRDRGRRQRQKQWREQITTQVDAEPIYQLIEELRRADGLDREHLVAEYGPEIVKTLPHRTVKLGGASPDAAAYRLGAQFPEMGITTGADLISTLAHAWKKPDLVARRLAQRIADYEAGFKADDYVLQTKEYDAFLAIIGKYENRDARRLPPFTAFKLYAKAELETKPVREAIRHDLYLSRMKKHARIEADKARQKKFREAADANEIVRTAYVMAGQAVKNRKEVEKTDKKIKAVSRPKAVRAIDEDYLEALLALGQRFGLGTKSTRPRKPGGRTPKSLSELLAVDPDTLDPPPAFSPELIDQGAPMDYRDLSMAQFRELSNLIGFLIKKGRDRRVMWLSDRSMTVESAAQQIAEESKAVRTKPVHDKLTSLRWIAEKWRGFTAELSSLNFIALALGGYKGVGWRGEKTSADTLITERLVQAQNAQTELFRTVHAQARPHLDHLIQSAWELRKKYGRRIRIPGAAVPRLIANDGQADWWTAEQIFAIMLNLGNESNQDRLFKGYDDLTPETIEALKDTLSEKDFDAIQGLWDTIESLYPELDRIFFARNGFHMAKIEATEVQTPYGTLRGGYYPAVYDNRIAEKIAFWDEREDLLNRTEAMHQVPSVKSGMTITRKTGVQLPLKLSLSVASRHLSDTVHYITHTEAVNDVDRITRHPAFVAQSTRILGRELHGMIRPALIYIARPERIQNGFWENTLEKMRLLTTPFILAWNASVAIKQVFSSPSAATEIGLADYLNGFRILFTQGPRKLLPHMRSISTYMNQRKTSWDREVGQQFRQLSHRQLTSIFGKAYPKLEDLRNFGFWPIQAMDTFAVLPIWFGSYERGLRQTGDPKQAVLFADEVIRRTQPSAQPLDMTYWQRAGGAYRLFSLFQTFTVGKYGQRQRLYFNAMRNQAITKSEYTFHLLMEALVPGFGMPILFALLWGRDLEDEDVQKDIALEALKYWFLAGLPVISAFSSSYSGPLDSPVASGPEALKRFGQDSYDFMVRLDEGSLEDLVVSAATLASFASGVPASQIIKKARKGLEQDGYPWDIIIPTPKKYLNE